MFAAFGFLLFIIIITSKINNWSVVLCVTVATYFYATRQINFTRAVYYLEY